MNISRTGTRSGSAVAVLLVLATPVIATTEVSTPDTSPSTSNTSPAGRIAYQARDGIWTMEADGSQRLQISHVTGDRIDYDPAVSPDGTLVASRSSRARGGDGILIANADGSGERDLAVLLGLPEGFGVAQASWSPDGRLVFACICPQNLTANSGLYTADPDGSGLTKLNDDGQYPDWSPDGARIAFMGDREAFHELYVMNADGSGTERLTDNAHQDNVPDWSPDGDRLAFFSDRDGNEEIYVVEVLTGEVTRVTKTPDRDEEMPVWTPDGRIAFNADGDDDGELEWYLSMADGSGELELSMLTEAGAGSFVDWLPPSPGEGGAPGATPTGDVASPRPSDLGEPSGHVAYAGDGGIWVSMADGSDPRQVTHDGGFDPTWSPDGRSIAYRVIRAEDDGEVMVVDTCGGVPRSLSNDPDYSDWGPEWSPDGTRIGYSSDREIRGIAVWVMNADGSEQRVVTAGHGEYPSWAPDGQRIAYAGGGYYDIRVVDLDSGQDVAITSTPAYEMGPAWSPDGEWIAYHSQADHYPRLTEPGQGPEMEIHIVRPDGSDDRRLTSDLIEDAFPAWSPDGRLLMWSRMGELVVADTEGKHLRRIGSGNFPAWTASSFVGECP